MTTNLKRLYWDTSCFICFLNPDETERRAICEDVLHHAERGELEILISTWVIVEVIRPKKPGNEPLPKWAIQAIEKVPDAELPLKELWKRHQRSPTAQKLTDEQITKIESMFEWPFVKKLYLDERTAKKAVELCRQFELRPGDAVHVASALIGKCDSLQKWDKDFDKVKHLIAIEEPSRISPQKSLFEAAIPPVSESAGAKEKG
jgi:predicted nucleic acid-binding protein